MRGIYKRAALALAAGALVVGLAGCAAESAPVSDPSKGDNTQLAYTGAESADEQSFDTVTFGSYQGQDITWLKLAEENGKTLLISEQVLDAVPYDDSTEAYQWSVQSPRPQKDIEWATSSIRTWLNGEFLKAAFSADEQGAIAATTLTDTKNNVSHTAATAADPSVHAAEETTDQVFLLSLAEAKQYFANNAARVAHPTDYAVKQGVYVGVASNDEQPDGAAAWWLRSNGYYAGYASVVTDDGYVHGDGYRMAADGSVVKTANHSGGVLGGISDGSDLVFRAAFKPTPSISRSQETVSRAGENIELSIKGRHDPVVVPRAVVVVEAMAALTVMDMLLVSMSSRLDMIQLFFQVENVEGTDIEEN